VAQRRLDDELSRLMLTLQGVMRTEFGEGLDLQSAADEASIEVIAPDRTLVLTHPDGQLLAMWGRPILATWRPPLEGGSTLSTVVIDSMRARLLSQRTDYQGHRYVAAVLVPLHEFEAENAALHRALMLGVVAALAIAGIGGWVIGRQALGPLADMAMQAKAITESNPVDRLSTPNQHDELGTLAIAFNGLLDRLAGVLYAQRQFMADASHELRTPVSVVRTTAQVTLTRDTRSTEEYRESMTIVGEQADRLSRLVDAMFLLSRAEARGLPLMPEALNVDDIVSECARALRVLAVERGVTIQTDGDVEVALVGDDRLLRHMVTNLIDNAVRHARRNGSVVVTVRRLSSVMTIRVVDDGHGVPVSAQQRIFQRFVRLDSDYAGAGLGLPIARWIAEAHGGQLVLESSGATGSTFAVTLPVSEGLAGS
jgi:signal transduction histidine kinase